MNGSKMKGAIICSDKREKRFKREIGRRRIIWTTVDKMWRMCNERSKTQFYDDMEDNCILYHKE
jgi:hypothetical protein